MNIDQMHSVFRVLGQQMGMQHVRSILPESIDVFINAEIGSMIQEQLAINAQIETQNNASVKSMNLVPVNLFRTLYRKDEIPIALDRETDAPDDQQTVFSYAEIATDKYYKIYVPNIQNVGGSKSEDKYPVYDDDIITRNQSGTINYEDSTFGWKKNPINPMLYLGISILEKDKPKEKAIDCRLIGGDILETTLNDYCNGVQKESPIAVLMGESFDINENKIINAEYFEIYTKNIQINKVFLSYIKYPNVVCWNEDPTKRIDCDLPEYIHNKIVEGAVRRYQIAIGSVSQNSNNKD